MIKKFDKVLFWFDDGILYSHKELESSEQKMSLSQFYDSAEKNANTCKPNMPRRLGFICKKQNFVYQIYSRV
jgi:hypothetical protein